MSRTITVFGATGTQGGSVIDALFADGAFKPRAITRNVSSDAALKLKLRGVEVVQGNLNLEDTDPLAAAVAGSECVFAVTNFVDVGPTHEGEIAQGKRMIDGAKRVGVKFFIWSSLEDYKTKSGGKYTKIHHFNAKKPIDDYLKSSGLQHAILYTSWFAENITIDNPD